VEEIIIFDDGEHRDLREVPLYKNLFMLLEGKGILWKYEFSPRKGQVFNHQLALERAIGNWIWRLDDDNVPENNVLEKLVSNITDEVGAVAGLVIDPKNTGLLPKLASNKIEDIFLGLNIQWFYHHGVTEVDHLYSSFLYRKSAGAHGYCLDLSPVGHREETIFTYTMERAGWKLLVDASAVTWHLREDTGGIRSYSDKGNWIHDEEIFKKKLQEWGISPRKTKIIVLNCGLGDHYAFLSVLDHILEYNKENHLVLSVCYPEVFKDTGLDLISIAEAGAILSKEEMDEMNAYKWCWDRGYKKSLPQAFLEMYT